jgi:hypothetical protein
MPTSELIEYAGETMPAPKFATPRNFDRPTLGPLRADFARIWLRKPLMPWQRMVADVAGELDPDTGLPWYDLIVTTVQRRAGKSHLSMTKTCERCVSVPGWKAWYTAQTGGDARDAFLQFHEEVIGGTPLDRLVNVLVSNGREAMRFPNKSQLRPHPPIEKALHGRASDENDIDEAWSFTAEEGRALLQAISPTQLTRPWAQSWIWSAGGTAASTWLAQLVADGRAGARAVSLAPGAAPARIAYFEWGIPDDLDLADLAAIASYHPAYGHTVSLDSIRKLRTQLTDDAEFARAAGNRWTEVIGGAIAAELWRAGRRDAPIPDDAPVAFGAARAADGSEVAIAAAARVGDQVVVELLDVIPSAFDAHDKIVDVWLAGAPVAVDAVGPSKPLADKLERAGATVLDMAGGDQAIGVADVLDGLKAGRYGFRPHKALDAAVKVAGTRRIGDGGVAWARVKAGASIAALDAATAAVWALEHKPKPLGKPTYRAPGDAA